jgi:hypothetical protein
MPSTEDTATAATAAVETAKVRDDLKIMRRLSIKKQLKTVREKKLLQRMDNVNEEESPDRLTPSPPTLAQKQQKQASPSTPPITSTTNMDETSSDEGEENIEAYLSDLNEDMEWFDTTQPFVSVHRCHYRDLKDNVRKGKLYLTNSDLLFKCSRMPFVKLRLSFRDIVNVNKVKNHRQKFESVVLVESKDGKVYEFSKFKVPKNLIKNIIMQLVEKNKKSLPILSSDSGSVNMLPAVGGKKPETPTTPTGNPNNSEDLYAGSSPLMNDINAKVIFRRAVRQPFKESLIVLNSTLNNAVDNASFSPASKRAADDVGTEAASSGLTGDKKTPEVVPKKLTLKKLKRNKSMPNDDASFNRNTLVQQQSSVDSPVGTPVVEEKYVAKFAKNSKKGSPSPPVALKKKGRKKVKRSEGASDGDADIDGDSVSNKTPEELAGGTTEQPVAEEEGQENSGLLRRQPSQNMLSSSSSYAEIKPSAVKSTKMLLVTDEELNRLKNSNKMMVVVMLISFIIFALITGSNLFLVHQIERQIRDLM